MSMLASTSTITSFLQFRRISREDLHQIIRSSIFALGGACPANTTTFNNVVLDVNKKTRRLSPANCEAPLVTPLALCETS
eukprot:2330820-Prorocentrum_lima.AAC.1